MENSQPKISVVMPFYNASKFLDEAVTSVLNQTFTDFELIIINDASKDNSDEVMQKYLSDPRVVYIKNEENRGIVYNLNYCIGLAKSELIARMDGDDVCEPERFAKQYEFMQDHPEIAVVGSNVRLIDENSRQFDVRTKPTDPQEITRELIIYCPVVHPATMFRKSIIQKAGGYRQEYLYSEDVDLWYRVAYSGNLISNVSDFLLKYRYHLGSTAHRAKENARRDFRLRMETIKLYKLKVTLRQRLLIYVQLLVGLYLTGRQRQQIEGWYKKIFYHEK